MRMGLADWLGRRSRPDTSDDGNDHLHNGDQGGNALQFWGFQPVHRGFHTAQTWSHLNGHGGVANGP